MDQNVAIESSPASRAKGATLLETFDYEGVRLLPSRFLAQVERAREVYGSAPNDDILKGFRLAAGLPAPGGGMRGWCVSTSAVIFGQLLSGLTRLGKATGDAALLDKASTLFHGWRETLPDDGNARMRLYDWEKLVCGLVDLEQYAGIDTLPTLRKTVQWAARTFDRSRHAADGHDFWAPGPAIPRNGIRCRKISTEPTLSQATTCSGTLPTLGYTKITGDRSPRRPRRHMCWRSTPIAMSKLQNY